MSELRLGMIGLDTSHCNAFTDLLNLKDNPHHVPGGKVVVAYPGGSQDFALSRDRVASITTQLQERHGIKIVDSIEAVAAEADAILLESVDGRQHLEQFRVLAPFHKPVFIDKPLTTSVTEARKIYELSRKYNTPVFSCSSLRYAAGIAELGAGQRIMGCEAFGPMSILPDFPGLFWYGIHSAEILFAKMGAGCQAVRVVKGESADTVTGVWADGRVGSLYGYRIPKLGTFGATVFYEGGVAQSTAKTVPAYYAMLLPHVIEFFRTGDSPVTEAETMEIIAFLEAANLSRESGEAVELGGLL